MPILSYLVSSNSRRSARQEGRKAPRPQGGAEDVFDLRGVREPVLDDGQDLLYSRIVQDAFGMPSSPCVSAAARARPGCSRSIDPPWTPSRPLSPGPADANGPRRLDQEFHIVEHLWIFVVDQCCI